MDDVSSFDKQHSKLISQYIDNMNCSEQTAYKIAIDHLKTSFDIEKSIGFIDFKKNIEDDK